MTTTIFKIELPYGRTYVGYRKHKGDFRPDAIKAEFVRKSRVESNKSPVYEAIRNMSKGGDTTLNVIPLETGEFSRDYLKEARKLHTQAEATLNVKNVDEPKEKAEVQRDYRRRKAEAEFKQRVEFNEPHPQSFAAKSKYKAEHGGNQTFCLACSKAYDNKYIAKHRKTAKHIKNEEKYGAQEEKRPTVQAFTRVKQEREQKVSDNKIKCIPCDQFVNKAYYEKHKQTAKHQKNVSTKWHLAQHQELAEQKTPLPQKREKRDPTRLDTVYCNVCNDYFSKNYYRRHLKTKKHLKNISE